MKIRTIQRANTAPKHSMREWHVLKAEAEFQLNRTREGKKRRLAVHRCDCGQKHFGLRSCYLTPNQNKVEKLCNKCFAEKYGKSRPPKIANFVCRNLSQKEIYALERYYEANGVTISQL